VCICLHYIHNIFCTSKCNIENIKKYGKVAAMQASEVIKQNVTWYSLYGGGRFNWSHSGHQVLENPMQCWYSATWYCNPVEHNVKQEQDITVIATFHELLVNVH